MSEIRSVYRTPTREQNVIDPHLVLDISGQESQNYIDANSDIGLVYAKRKSVVQRFFYSAGLNSNYRILFFVFLITALFLIGFGSGYLTKKFIHESTFKARLSGFTSDMEYGDAKYFYNYTSNVRRAVFDAVDVDAMVSNLKKLTSFGPHPSGSAAIENVKDYIVRELSNADHSHMIVKKHESTVLLSTNECAGVDDNKMARVNVPNPVSILGEHLAFAPNKSTQGPLIFALYGRERDFSRIKRSEINVTGSIALIRFGKIPTYDKVQNAMEAGCSGVILYAESPSDVKEDWVGEASHFAMSDTLLSPEKIPHAMLSIVPTSVLNYTKNLQYKRSIPTIPVISICEKEAADLIKTLNQESGQAAIVLNARDFGLKKPSAGSVVGFGPTITKYQLNSCSMMKLANITNIIGILPGYIESDRFVIVASHHDSWGPGGIDPHSGTAVMLGLARAIAKNPEMRPRRSIMFVSFDAEEMGFLGSAEFVKSLETQFGAGSAVGAIYLGGVLRGNYIPHIKSDPILRDLFYDAATSISSLSGGFNSLFEEWSERSNLVKREKHKREKPFIGQLDATSDHAMLSFHAGIPTTIVEMWYDFIKHQNMSWYPAYHTLMDNFDYVQNADPDWKALEAVTKLTADAVLRLAGSVVLPLDCRPVNDYMIASLDKLLPTIHSIYDIDINIQQLHGLIDKHGNICQKLMEKDRELLAHVDDSNRSSWHFADVRNRNDALVLSLQPFVQQPVSYTSQYYAGSLMSESKGRRPFAHSATHFRHVLFPPSMSTNPFRSPAFYALDDAVTKLKEDNGLKGAQLTSQVVLEYTRLVDAIKQSTQVLERSLVLRQLKSDK